MMTIPPIPPIQSNLDEIKLPRPSKVLKNLYFWAFGHKCPQKAANAANRSNWTSRSETHEIGIVKLAGEFLHVDIMLTNEMGLLNTP